ncbi:reverse transcriptase domain-containing protein [Tanacetum coccineum]
MRLSNIERIIVARACHEEELLITERNVKESMKMKKRMNELEMQNKKGWSIRVQQCKCSSPRENTDAEDGQISKDDAEIDNDVAGASHDKVKITKIHDSQPVSDHEQSCHVQPESIKSTYVDDQIDSNIIFDDTDMEDNSGNVEHDTSAHDQHRAKMESLMRNVQLEAAKTHKINAEKEDKYLNDIIQLQAKNKDLENIVCNMGKSSQTLRMFTNEQSLYQENIRKLGLGYKDPCFLKQAVACNPKLYNAYDLRDENVQLHVHDTEDILEDAEESRLKMKEKLDDVSPPMNISSISEAMQPTLRRCLKRACNQISYLETHTQEVGLKNPYPICDYCGGSHEADECKQTNRSEQVCLSGGDIYDDPSLLRFYQNDDTQPWGNSKRKEKGEDGPEWIIRSKFEDELANFMLEKKSHAKGIGISTQDPHFPASLRPSTNDFTERETEKEGTEGAEPSMIKEPASRPSILYQPSKSSNLPFPSRLKKQKKDDEDERLLLIFKQIHINLPFLEAMIHMPKGTKVLKDLLSHKEKLEKPTSLVKLSEECSTIIQRSLPQKEGDPGSFTLPCLIRPLAVKNALADLGASINLMPHSLFRQLRISKLKPTQMSIQLANRSIKYPIGVCENLVVKISKFIFPVDFVVLEMDKDELVPIILGLPFLAMARAVIDVHEGKLSLKVRSKTVTFNIRKSMKSKHSRNNYLYCVNHTAKLVQEQWVDTVNHDGKWTKEEEEEDFNEVLAVSFYPRTYPWVSLVQIVPKKGGMTVVKNEKDELIPQRTVTGWRVCIDYRKLNNATRKDHFPLSFIDQMLERLAGHEYYCFLDGFSGYFQIPIAPEDQEKTMFTCPYGTFAYKRMPFGLCNAPATFQRYMAAIFHELIEDSMEEFMDDFSVFGRSFDHCLKNLEKILKRCDETNLVLNWEKGHFMVKEEIILGHKVSGSGIEVDNVTPRQGEKARRNENGYHHNTMVSI